MQQEGRVEAADQSHGAVTAGRENSRCQAYGAGYGKNGREYRQIAQIGMQGKEIAAQGAETGEQKEQGEQTDIFGQQRTARLAAGSDKEAQGKDQGAKKGTAGLVPGDEIFGGTVKGLQFDELFVGDAFRLADNTFSPLNVIEHWLNGGADFLLLALGGLLIEGEGSWRQGGG